MKKINIFHGSDRIIKKPEYLLGKKNNDYGQGFYCTSNLEMAKEWACKNNNNGYVNKYLLDMSGLKVLNLLDGNYNILNWMALLLKNRLFSVQDEIALDAKKYIIDNFSIDTTGYDIIIGYRADDSYFSFAQSFISNSLSLNSLNKALYLGELGTQIVIVSGKAFEKIEFVNFENVEKEIYYNKFLKRDKEARIKYQEEIKKESNYREDIFIIDILRKEMKSDDECIQRIVFK